MQAGPLRGRCREAERLKGVVAQACASPGEKAEPVGRPPPPVLSQGVGVPRMQISETELHVLPPCMEAHARSGQSP